MSERIAVLHPRAAGQWPEVNRLLDEALALAEGERREWIDSLPPTPAKAVVERLLGQRARIESADFLGTLPTLSPAALACIDAEPAALALQPDDEVGPWRLLRPLGQGGMGAVWLAERVDGSLKRQVALKLPNRSWNAALAERMLRERDILASLTHPHIARLYDAGFDAQGRPFLALEYVDGSPIDQFVRSGALTAPRIVALLLQVADAVAHAHSRLVIHRDLKPSNILVDAQGQVRLLDFGIAKLVEGERTEETALTRAAGHVLTPEYASPEQVSGAPLTTSSDVYGLAVVAYELLAGCRPYRLKRGTLAELEEAIAQADPPRASEAVTDPTARKALRGDLDAILNKALKKRPEERYATVVAFAEDLQRHLDGHAVLARPDSRWYVARKFVARHRVPVAAATATVAALGIGLGAALWQTAVARENLAHAQRTIDRENAVRVLYIETLSTIAGWDAARFAEPQSVVKQLHSKLEELEVRYRDQPDALMSVLHVVSQNLPYMGDTEGALAVALRHRELLAKSSPRSGQLMVSSTQIARLQGTLGRPAEAEATLRTAIATIANQEQDPEQRARMHSDLGKVLAGLGKRQEAIDTLRRAIELVEAAPTPQRVRGEILQILGRVHMGFDDQEALRQIELAHRDVTSMPDVQQVALQFSLLHLGMARTRAGRAEDAEAALREGLRLSEQLFGPVDRDTVRHASELARALAGLGRYAEARALLHERRELVEKRPGSDTELALALLNAGQLETEVLYGDLAAAQRFLSTRTLNQHLTIQAGDVQSAREAEWLRASGRAREVAPLIVRWLQALPPALHADRQGFRMRLAMTQGRSEAGESDAARAEFAGLLALMQRQGATRHWLYREATEWAASASAAAGDAAAASRLLRELDTAHPPDGLPAPSRAERAESALRRARVAFAAGERGVAARWLQAAESDLTGQHPTSQRLAAARELAHALAR